VRLFVAVRPDERALAALERAVQPLRTAAGGPRWVDPARWHVTLAFLGEVAEPRLPRLAAALDPAALDPMALGRPAALGPAVPVRLRIAGAGTFPARSAPRVLWAGLAGDLAALHTLARVVGRAARSAGIPVERRPFAPHLTLGRWRPGDPVDRDLVQRLASYAGPAFEVGEYLLMRSHLGPAPRYDLLRTWSLPGRA